MARLDKHVIWASQPKQTLFQQRSEYEALYGGAAGGGKSDALVTEALRQVHIPHYKGIIFRKTYPQLAELIDRSLYLYKLCYPKARYNGGDHYWRFPSGAKIYFGNMQREADRTNYQGRAFDFVGFDELTHFTWDEYSYMFSRNRPTGPGTLVYIRATTNPGGKGHGWVKDRFITAAPPLTPITGEYKVAMPDGRSVVYRRKRIFVPANVYDNPQLLHNDPYYLANLAMMPEAERNALLYGSWDSFDGQAFREWTNDPEHYDDRQYTHVISPFTVPAWWPVYRSFDFGYARPFSVGWFTVDPNSRIYRIAELYGCTSEPNHGIKIDPHEIAARIKQIETTSPMLQGRKISGVADPSIFDESRGQSIAQMMAAAPNFIYWTPADNTRIPGKMQFHYRFAFGDDGYPMLYIFSTCKQFIRTIPSLVYDDKHVEDIDTDQEDHIYDECRYFLMEHPIPPRKNKAPDRKPYNPLGDERVQNRDKFKFYRI